MERYIEKEFDDALKTALNEYETERFEKMPSEENLRYLGDLRKMRSIEKSVKRKHIIEQVLPRFAMVIAFVFLCASVVSVFMATTKNS